MTMKLKLVAAMLCVGALFAPVAMAQTKEFVAETPNLPDPTRPVVTPMSGGAFPGQTVPEPGSLPLVAVAAVAAAAFLRRKK